VGPSPREAIRIREVDRRQDVHHVRDARPVGDWTTPPPRRSPEGVSTFFTAMKPQKGDRLVVFGWAMAESLASGKLPK